MKYLTSLRNTAKQSKPVKAKVYYHKPNILLSMVTVSNTVYCLILSRPIRKLANSSMPLQSRGSKGKSNFSKSGKSKEGRFAFKQMLYDIENGLEIDYILYYNLSRFGRNAADILNSSVLETLVETIFNPNLSIVSISPVPYILLRT